MSASAPVTDEHRREAWELLYAAWLKSTEDGPAGHSEEPIAQALAVAYQRGREDAALQADAWSNPSVVKLAAGEMTAPELRTAQAVARGIAAAIRSATPPAKWEWEKSRLRGFWTEPVAQPLEAAAQTKKAPGR